jgi:hypothetical protein
MDGRSGSPEYYITRAMVDDFRWNFFLRDCGGVGVSPGLFLVSGNQRKGMHDDEPIVLYFSVIRRSLQGMKRIGTGASGRVWSFLSSVQRCSSSGGITTA